MDGERISNERVSILTNHENETEDCVETDDIEGRIVRHPGVEIIYNENFNSVNSAEPVNSDGFEEVPL